MFPYVRENYTIKREFHDHQSIDWWNSLFKDFIPKAFQIMRNIDEDDTSFLALALMINGDGIWTNDPHFKKQNEIKVWKTKDMIKLL